MEDEAKTVNFQEWANTVEESLQTLGKMCVDVALTVRAQSERITKLEEQLNGAGETRH